MNEQQFTQREIELLFKRIDEKLDGIYAQTSKTNGRVSTLETAVSDVEKTQATLGVKVTAGVFIASTVFATIIREVIS